MKQKNVSAFFMMVVAAALSVTGCKAPNGAASGKNAIAETVYAVNTYRAQADNLDAYLEFGGDVEAASSVDVVPDATGKLARVYVRIGQYVQRNQLLAEIDPSRPGMNYAFSPIRAPIAGTVTSFPISVGTQLAPSMSVGKISSTGNLEISINVAERFVSKIRLGQTALLVFDAYPGESFTAEIVEISPVLDITSRTMAVKLNVDTSDRRIKIGMYARVKLITDERKDIIIIPNDALVRRQGKTYVFVVNRNPTAESAEEVKAASDAATEEDGKKSGASGFFAKISKKTPHDADTKAVDAEQLVVPTVHLVDVKEGIRVDDKVEIIAGLFDSDEIVVKGQTLLDEGSKVNVVTVVNEGAKI